MSSTKRFCLDARTATDHFPGIGRYVKNLAKEIPLLLHRDEELLLLWDSRFQSRPALPTRGPRILLIDTRASPFSAVQQWRIPALLRRCRASTYHSPYYCMPYWGRTPAIVTLFDLTPRLVPGALSRSAQIVFRVAVRLAMKRSQLLLVPSEATEQDILHYYSGGTPPLEITHLAPDLHFQPQSKEGVSKIRRKYGLPTDYVLHVGINKPHKNLVRLLEAWTLVVEKERSTALVFAGNWDERYPAARKLIEALGQHHEIRLLGAVPESDLPALYTGARIFVFPSLCEGFGLPVVEAMACGTAVACSRIPTLVEVGGEAAVYFDPTDVSSMSQQICRLLGDRKLREDYRQRGLQRASQFSWQETAAKTLALYRRLCAGGYHLRSNRTGPRPQAER